MNIEDLKDRLDKSLGTLDGKHIIMLKSDSKNYSDSVFETLRYVTGKGMGGVYLTSALPQEYISEKLEKYGINTENLYFIDTVSCMMGSTPGERGRCALVKSPGSLDDIEMLAYKLIDKIEPEEKFLLIDSVSNLLIYNDACKLVKFSESLIKYMRSKKIRGVIASVAQQLDEGFHRDIAMFCDIIIKI